MKVIVEITCSDNIFVEIKRLMEDFCYGLLEDISPDISFTIGEDNNVTV